MLLTLLVFLVILSVLVFIHELGHFLVAKKLGIKVEEFGFGFPPRAWGKKIGETIYSINWLPIGGFVKLYGEDDAGGGKISAKGLELRAKEEDLKRAFFARPVRQRIVVVVAGVVMNALLAVVIYYTYLGISDFKTVIPLHPKSTNPRFIFVKYENITEGVEIAKVVKNSPAEIAGITASSKVIKVNDSDVVPSEFIEFINKHKGKEIRLLLERPDAQRYEATVVPRADPPEGEGPLGVKLNIMPFSASHLSYETFGQKVFSGFSHSYNILAYSIDIMGKLITTSVEEGNAKPLGEGVSGPVGIFSLVGIIVKIPELKIVILQLLNLAGILSLSLALFNILPIPALDGGRLFFIVLEGIIGRRVNPKIEGYIHTVGMVILLGLVALITLKDLRQLIF